MRRPTRPIPRMLAVLVALAAATGACSSDDAATAERARAVTTTTRAAGLPAGAADLVGRYAHFDVVAYEDDAMKTLIISTGFADLSQRGGRLWNQMTFCHADTVTDLDIEVSISDAATRAIKPVATPVAVTERGGKLHVSRPRTPTAIGIRLEDPAREALPSDPADPRVFDADGDGHPGVTSKVKVSEALQGEIYIARREIFAYDLTQQSADRLVGSVTDRSEQLILGASNDVFLVAAQWHQIDDPARNPVIWQRVDADWDCADLARERDRIFPANPAADW